MGRRRERNPKSITLPPSPSHSFSSSSSSDFEFTVSLSPHRSTPTLCPADELFYKGQLLPLHPSPRLSMVRTLFLASSSTSSSSDATSTTASRDSSGSSNDSHSSFSSDLVLLADCDSSRPSSVAEDDEFKRLNYYSTTNCQSLHHHQTQQIKKPRYFSLLRFSSVFRKDAKSRNQENVSGSSVKRMSTSAKEVVRKYLKKVKPLYDKLSPKQQQQQQQQQQKMAAPTSVLTSVSSFPAKSDRSAKDEYISAPKAGKDNNGRISHSFSGNLRYPRKRSCASSCPSSMRSSPTHSGVLFPKSVVSGSSAAAATYYADTSSMEELQSAIQGAIAHCKNSMTQNKDHGLLERCNTLDVATFHRKLGIMEK